MTRLKTGVHCRALGIVATLCLTASCGAAPSEVGAEYFLLSTGDCVTADGAGCLSSLDVDAGQVVHYVPVETAPVAEPQVSGSDLAPPAEDAGGCWVTGIGTFGKGATRDSFGGNGMTMKDGRIRGEWNHVDHFDESGSQKNGQNHFHGQVEYLACERFPTLNGPDVPKAIPNFAVWGGRGKYNNVPGYLFEVHAFDHNEGGNHHDRYEIDIYDADHNLVLHADGMGTHDTPPKTRGCIEDVTVTPDLAWVNEMGCLSGGNFQIHPPNPGHP